jgi:hypothetical protein
MAHISNKETSLVRSEILEWFRGRQAFIDFHAERKDYLKVSKYIVEK